MADLVQLRRGSAAAWTLANPTLAQGELGIETDTQKFKCGDGSSPWSTLPYLIDAGNYATMTSVQTLTNKTLESPVVNSPTLNNGYTEEVFSVTGSATPTLSPVYGSIQTLILAVNATPTLGTWNSGQSITLMVDDSTGYTVDWTVLGVVWKTGSGTAPTLLTTGYTVITLWKVGTTIYGALVGNA